MRELLYEAAKHYRRGRALADEGDARGAGEAYEDALRDLQAVKPQRMRDVLLAQVYLSRHQLDVHAPNAASDLRLGYTYARTTCEPNVRQLAETLWREAVAQGRHVAPARGARRPRPPKGNDAAPNAERRASGDRRPAGERRPAPARAGDGAAKASATGRGSAEPERVARDGKAGRGRRSRPGGPEGQGEHPGDERAD